MTKEGLTYTFVLEGLEEGQVVRFQFATWLDGEQNFFLSGYENWKPASFEMGAENASLACTAPAFSNSTDTTVVFVVA